MPAPPPQSPPPQPGSDRLPVMVVGGGISGLACAREVAASGRSVVVWDRARRVGGRMSVRTVDNRPIDVGASYFTASDPAFLAVVEGWVERGLAHPWTDAFAVGGPDGLGESRSGPMRYGATDGLRALVEDLAEGLHVEHSAEVEEVTAGPTLDGLPAAAVVLAMPDPQAADLLDEGLAEEAAVLAGRDYEPTLVAYARWPRREWPDVHGVFVHGSPVLGWIADDGRRRGDELPVLVAHSTGEFAAARLDEPEAALEAMLAEVGRVLGVRERPRWAGVKRWSLSKPLHPHEEPYHLGAASVGLCGDSWGGRPRVEAAFLSGHRLGRALAQRLG